MQNTSKFEMLTPLFQSISEQLRINWPEKWEYQKQFYDQTNPEFKIPNTIFTTITVNKNYRTGCHKDPKNLEDSISAMLCIRRGNFTGGYLILPTWRIALKMDTGDICLFDSQKDWHGNTSIIPITKDTERCTLVCYLRHGMTKCCSAEEELEIVKRRHHRNNYQRELT